jgi:hypothetical protein
MKQVYIYNTIKILLIITFILLLAACIYWLNSLYVCDQHTCKVFNDAGAVAAPGTKEYTLTLLANSNGVAWPLAFIAATIATAIVLLFADTIITFNKILAFFFTIFLVFYFINSFYEYHYTWQINHYISTYIADSCPATPA